MADENDRGRPVTARLRGYYVAKIPRASHPGCPPTPGIPMLSPDQVIEAYFLEARHQLLEIAALLDRHDAAVAREGRGASPAGAAKLAVLKEAIATLADDRPAPERTVALLELFAMV